MRLKRTQAEGAAEEMTAPSMKGIYQHCGEQHLHRNLAEFDFRYSNRAKLGCTDKERAEKALKGIVGKRLTYRRVTAGCEGC